MTGRELYAAVYDRLDGQVPVRLDASGVGTVDLSAIVRAVVEVLVEADLIKLEALDPDPTAGVCPDCQEIAHDRDCPRAGDGRPVEGVGS